MPDFVDTFFNNYGANTNGMTDASYANKVYLGTQNVEGYTTKSPTGGSYTVKPTTKDVTESIAQAKSRYLTDENLRNKWNVALRKNGIDANPIQARAIWDLSVDGASDWYATSNGKQRITPEQYLNWYAGGQKKAAPTASRSIYEYAPEQLAAKIDDVAKSLLGRTITDADKSAEWYQDLNSTLNKMAMQGTVTEPTKKVKNPKTGKMETVSIQRPEVTSEGITQTITSALKEADPVSLERKQNLDFANWAFQKMGGRG
jgi:hypothetical protein